MRFLLKSKLFYVFLAIAFLSMQSASAHIHLSSQHDHDGHDHFHTQTIHAHHSGVHNSHHAVSHNSLSHHVDVFAETSEPHSTHVVELKHSCIVKSCLVKSGKWLYDIDTEPFISLVSLRFKQPDLVHSVSEYCIDASRSHFNTKVQARAPPALLYSHI